MSDQDEMDEINQESFSQVLKANAAILDQVREEVTRPRAENAQLQQALDFSQAHAKEVAAGPTLRETAETLMAIRYDLARDRKVLDPACEEAKELLRRIRALEKAYDALNDVAGMARRWFIPSP